VRSLLAPPRQVTELRPVPGIDVIGELPADLQKQILCSAGIPASLITSNAGKGMDAP